MKPLLPFYLIFEKLLTKWKQRYTYFKQEMQEAKTKEYYTRSLPCLVNIQVVLSTGLCSITLRGYS